MNRIDKERLCTQLSVMETGLAKMMNFVRGRQVLMRLTGKLEVTQTFQPAFNGIILI